MSDLVQLFGYFALCFASAMVVSFTWTTYRDRRKRLVMPEGTMLRLRCRHGVYRSKVLAETSTGWEISAPLQRDHHVALRPGESLVVQAAIEGGAVMFKSEITGRLCDSHALVIRKPSEFSRIERRTERRVASKLRRDAYLEGEAARVLDISQLGARIATRAPVSRGERVKLSICGRPEPMFGWVLETVPGSELGYDSAEVRVRFEEILAELPA
jgi:hypothetical protein